MPPAAVAERAGPGPAERLRLPAAHAVATGRGQRIAVIDTGVAPHPRLAGRLVGLGDALAGGTGLDDCDGHGTAVAGLIGAAADPRDGFVGVAPDARILAVRQFSPTVGGADGRPAGDLGSLAAAVRRSVEAGATVVNISGAVCCPPSGPRSTVRRCRSALRAAAAADVVVVAAAGNLDSGGCAADRPDLVSLPGWNDDVLTVGAVGPDDRPARFTMPGPWVDVAAPGTDVRSLTADGGTGPPLDGTSFAAPLVAGLAALIREHHPGLSAREVMDCITATARRPPAGRDDAVGSGVVDLVAALTTRARGAPLPAPGVMSELARPAPAAPRAGVADRRTRDSAGDRDRGSRIHRTNGPFVGTYRTNGPFVGGSTSATSEIRAAGATSSTEPVGRSRNAASGAGAGSAIPRAAAVAPSATPWATPPAETTHTVPTPGATPGADARTAPPSPTTTASSPVPAPSAPASTRGGRTAGIRPRCRPPTGSAPGSPDQVQQVTGVSAGSRSCGAAAGQPATSSRCTGARRATTSGPISVTAAPRSRGQHVRRQGRHLLEATVEDDVTAWGGTRGPTHDHVADPRAQTGRPGCPRATDDRRHQRRPLGKGRDEAGGRRTRCAAGEPECRAYRDVAEVDPVPAARGDQPRVSRGHREQNGVDRVRAGHRTRDHGRSQQPARRTDLVADRPPRRDPPLRVHAHGARDGGCGGPRCTDEGLVVDEYRVGTHRHRPQRGEHEPPRDGVRDGHQPVRFVRDDIQRARRPADHQVLLLPRRTRSDDRRHQRPDQAEDAQHDPGGDGPALRAHLLVHGHRVAADQGGLQPAQAEAVRVGLVAGGRSRRRHPQDARRTSPAPRPFRRTRGPDQPTEIASRRSRMNGAVTTEPSPACLPTGGASGVTTASWSSS